MNSKSKTTNPWRETVREIYELAIQDHVDTDRGSIIVAEIIERIEKNHHEYFCKGIKHD